MTFKNSLNAWFRSYYFAITSIGRLMWYNSFKLISKTTLEKCEITIYMREKRDFFGFAKNLSRLRETSSSHEINIHIHKKNMTLQ